ncbi:MAG: N-acetyltransferase [Planctomycetia bacterium]|nr:N-acetyltransferase [Planctomycetia bacterium]
MKIQYVKRYEMVLDLMRTYLGRPTLPESFFWVPWNSALTATHAYVKFVSFRNELDAVIFPTFTSYESCLRLMGSIASKNGFIPQATWMIANRLKDQNSIRYCSTIQGILQKGKLGAIQNVAVIPDCRKMGLGKALVLKSLFGFKSVGCEEVSLEVTADNFPAVHLYREIGFKIIRTLYKETFIP